MSTEYPPPSDDVLEHMAEEHVFYELHRTLEFAYFGNVLPMRHDLDPLVRADLMAWSQSSILEASLIHLRNISDFLTKPRPTSKHAESDLVADHYFVDHWSGRPDFIFGGDPGEHRTMLAEIHRRVAHLSTQRYTVKGVGAFEWQQYVETQFPILLQAFGRFLTDLQEHEPERARWFDRSVDLLVNFRYLRPPPP